MLERVWDQTGKLAAVDKEDAKRGASFSVVCSLGTAALLCFRNPALDRLDHLTPYLLDALLSLAARLNLYVTLRPVLYDLYR
jgi:hypothetical protein